LGAAVLCLTLFERPLRAATCLPTGTSSSVDQIVARVGAEQRRYIFVGEIHRVGPVKKFVVDLTNELVDRGYDVGLYVEGFRTDCPLREDCTSLARIFNREAFQTLLDQSRAPVHAIDPPQSTGRVASMAARIAGGTESIRVVLAGRTHVLHAEDGGADLRVYGGGLRYPDPGDLAEAFERRKYLTVVLETVDGATAEYSVREDGCGADYLLTTPWTTNYGLTATVAADETQRPGGTSGGYATSVTDGGYAPSATTPADGAAAPVSAPAVQ
jgi:hypothetical protein